VPGPAPALSFCGSWNIDLTGFFQYRGPAGAVAENVAVGCKTEDCARRMWMRSPRHRANVLRGRCHAIASAESSGGRRYWVREIGGAAAPTQVKASSSKSAAYARPSPLRIAAPSAGTAGLSSSAKRGSESGSSAAEHSLAERTHWPLEPTDAVGNDCTVCRGAREEVTTRSGKFRQRRVYVSAYN
jgi:hypothetical protein